MKLDVIARRAKPDVAISSLHMRSPRRLLRRLLAMTSLFFLMASPVTAKFSLKDIFNIKNKPKLESSSQVAMKPSETLRIIVVSDANLCPTPLSPGAVHDGSLIHDFQLGFEEFSKTLLGKKDKAISFATEKGVLYDQSQVLLQETIREIIGSLKTKNVDLVIFGGNQVYSNEYFSLFEDIVYDLQKHSIPYYSLVGSGELRGPKSINKLIDERFYLLKTKSTNIIVLDNAIDDVVPKFLPEEATEQYVWLKKILMQLSAETEDVYIFSYKPLQPRTIELINQYPNLKLKLLVNSSLYTFSVTDSTSIILANATKPIVLSNSSISKYPLSYTIIDRDTRGLIQISNKLIALDGIRELAKQKLR